MIKQVAKYGFLIFIFTIVNTNTVLGQNLLPSTSSSAKSTITADLKKMLNTSEAYFLNNDWKKCDSTANLLIQKAVKLESRFYEGRGYFLLGKSYMVQNQDAKAYLNLLRSSKIFYIIDEYQYLAESELQKGVLYNQRELWEKAFTSLSLADSLYQSVHFTFDLVELYGNLGKAAFHLDKNRDALLYLGLYKRYAIVHQQWDDQKEAIKLLIDTYRKTGDYQSAIQYDMALIKTYRQKNNEGYYQAIKELADDFYQTKNYTQAKTNYLIVLKNTKNLNDLVNSHLQLSAIALEEENLIDAIAYLNKAWAVAGDNDSKVEIVNQLTEIYISEEDYTKAKEYNLLAISLLDNVLIENRFKTYDLAEEIAVARKEYKEALEYTQLSAKISDSLLAVSIENKNKLAVLNSEINRYEISKQFEFIKDNFDKLTEEKQQLKEERIQQELQMLRLEQNTKKIEEENLRLRLKQAEKDAQLYQQKLDNQAKEAQIKAMQRRDTISQLLIAGDSIRELQHQQELEQIDTQKKLAQLKAEKAKRRNIYLLIFLVLVLFSLIIFIRSLKSAKKHNHLLEEKNTDIENKRKKLAETLKQLQAAQSQLIESERLASLGQLTAGIAHEIRNPLNFVNNFAKLSLEYADEITEIITANEKDFPKEIQEELRELTNYLKENSSRIQDHGNRAARIIARMLETARSDHAIKEPTDLNLLLEDSVNLAYQGIRGEFSDFIAEINFNFDSKISKVKLVAQDMGRVFINLVNNACQAMITKRKNHEEYQPSLYVTTLKKDKKIVIDIKDNGAGMPEAVQRKIFNPFFTTKEPGKGTGLGLTMSFDIVEKVHDGKISFKSVEGEYTEFIIELPIS